MSDEQAQQPAEEKLLPGVKYIVGNLFGKG